jgi:hypothetical protein
MTKTSATAGRANAARSVASAPEQSRLPTREGPNPHAQMLALQQTAGNRAVTSLVAGSSGRPLEQRTRAEMESKFGADFGQVRIHTDAVAENSALAASARAITIGQDIAFGSGFYDPATSAGKRLIAHELAHVIQQNQQSGRCVSRAAAESEARQAGADVASGRAAAVTGSASVGAQADLMSKEEIKRKIAEIDVKARQTTNKDEIDALFNQRQALIRQISEAEAPPSQPTPPPAGKQEVSVRGTALEVGEHELDNPALPGFPFPSKPSRTRDLTSMRLIVKGGTPMRTSVARSHWRSRAEVEQFMRDYIIVADEDAATKSQADEARRDRKLILQELTTAEEDVLAGRLKLARGQQHVEDVTARLRLQTPEVMKPRTAGFEVLLIETKMMDALIDFVPIVGEIKMLLEAATGMTISGQLDKAVYAPSELGTVDLDSLDRIMRVLPLAIAGASKIVSHAHGWAEALANVRKGTNLSEKALGKAISDTAKLAGREQEIAHALVAARSRRSAGLASRLEDFGIPRGKSANDVLPTVPRSNVKASAPSATTSAPPTSAPPEGATVTEIRAAQKGRAGAQKQLKPGERPVSSLVARRQAAVPLNEPPSEPQLQARPVEAEEAQDIKQAANAEHFTSSRSRGTPTGVDSNNPTVAANGGKGNRPPKRPPRKDEFEYGRRKKSDRPRGQRRQADEVDRRLRHEEHAEPPPKEPLYDPERRIFTNPATGQEQPAFKSVKEAEAHLQQNVSKKHGTIKAVEEGGKTSRPTNPAFQRIAKEHIPVVNQDGRYIATIHKIEVEGHTFYVWAPGEHGSLQ